MVSALLLLFVGLAAAVGSPPRPAHGRQPVRNVAIIGAGAAGASAAYHLSQYARDEHLPINITVFEKTTRVGGRTLTVHAYDDPNTGEEPIELGASIFVEANLIMHDAARGFGLTLDNPMPSNKGDLTIIWDGESIVFETTEGGSSWWWDAARMWWRYGMSPYRAISLVKTVVDTFLKLYEPPFFPFRSLTQRAYELGLERVTGVTGEQFLADYKINADFCRHVLQPATRVNYASNLAHIHGLETMVSFAADGAMAVRGGNWQVFDKMIQASGAKLYHNASVESINNLNTKPSGGKSATRSPKYALSLTGNRPVRTAFDDIIIATPWQYSNITASRGIITHKIDEIPYKELHVTLFTSPYRLRTDLFGLPRGGTPPSNVYTTLKPDAEADPKNVVGDTGFFSLSTLRTVINPHTQKREYLYKLFAPNAVPAAFLDSFFDSDWKEKHDLVEGQTVGEDVAPKKVSWHHMKKFNPYPVEFPRVTFQDPIVGNGIYYTSGIESFISTMETSALMGKNVARLLADDVAGNTGSGGAYVNPYRAATNRQQRQDFFQSMENDLDDMMMMDELSYSEYKRDTDSIATWLAATAKAAGFDASTLTGASAPASKPGQPSPAVVVGGRRKGKARKQAKLQGGASNSKASAAPAAPAGQKGAKYKIRIPDFTRLAEYILEKAIKVPQSFQDTLNRAISARAGFGARLEEQGSVVDPEADARHENFVDVLKHVRVILTSLMPAPSKADTSTDGEDDLSNRFAGLEVFDPSKEFLEAPDIKRPEKPVSDTATYAAEPSSSLGEAIFAMWSVINDLNNLRAHIDLLWRNYRDVGYDMAAAAIATNTAIEFVRSMEEDVVPLLEAHGGLSNVLEKCYLARCMSEGWDYKDLRIKAEDNFNYETYDVANKTYVMTYRLLDGFRDVLHPGEVPLYKDGMFGYFDKKSDRSKKSGTAKFHDDRALLMPFLTDLATVVMAVPGWPVHDEFLRGMKDMADTGRISLSMVFAAQIFLDITYLLGPAMDRPYSTYATHTNVISNDLKAYFEFHAELKIKTWPASNDAMIKEVRDSILWVGSDPMFGVHERLLRRYGEAPPPANKNRMLRMSPVISGLMLYHYRMRYREAGMAVADAWGSIQYCEHLYNALRSSQHLLDGRWTDMDIARAVLGTDSFYAGGEEPRSLGDQFKKFCLQMGVTASAMTNRRRRGAPLPSKSGPRGLKVNAPVSGMFGERYSNNAAMVLDAEQVRRIIDISTYELETDEETGAAFMGQIEDPKVLREKKRLQKELESGKGGKGGKGKQGAGNGQQSPVSLGRLTDMLAQALNAEAIELSFPYMQLHRWCWRVLRGVREKCDADLRRLVGPDYIENESQLPFVVGYALMLACGAEGMPPTAAPLQSAAGAVNVMLAAGTGSFIVEKTMGEIMGFPIEVVHE